LIAEAAEPLLNLKIPHSRNSSSVTRIAVWFCWVKPVTGTSELIALVRRSRAPHSESRNHHRRGRGRWPDAALVDRYVRHRPRPACWAPFGVSYVDVANTDVEAFLYWMRAHNERLAPSGRADSMELDLYNIAVRRSQEGVDEDLMSLKSLSRDGKTGARQRGSHTQPPRGNEAS